MCPAIDNPASCKICAVICFIHTKNMSAEEIHHETCAAIYGQNIMSEATTRQRRKMFKAGQGNVHDEEQSGWPSIVSDHLVQSVHLRICERWRFTISELSC
jgi:hypothetical protein